MIIWIRTVPTHSIGNKIHVDNLMKMNNPPSANDWEIASSIASSFSIGVKGGSPNAKIIYSAPIALDEASSDEERNLPRRFADHTYRDYATYIADGGSVLKHKKSESNFPARLYALLSDEEYAHMISWMVSYHTWNFLLGA